MLRRALLAVAASGQIRDLATTTPMARAVVDRFVDKSAENGMDGSSYTDIVRSDKVHELVAGYVDELNSRLNRWETIKKWEILDHDLTIESGELTPSMKVKRNVVQDNHEARIAALYA